MNRRELLQAATGAGAAQVVLSGAATQVPPLTFPMGKLVSDIHVVPQFGLVRIWFRHSGCSPHPAQVRDRSGVVVERESEKQEEAARILLPDGVEVAEYCVGAHTDGSFRYRYLPEDYPMTVENDRALADKWRRIGPAYPERQSPGTYRDWGAMVNLRSSGNWTTRKP